jgi:hypothetical protein
MKTIMKVFAASVSLVALSGCAGNYLNEGATRVRYTEPDATTEPPKFKAIYFKPAETRNNIIKKDECFSISLLSAYIENLRESRGLSAFTFDTSNSGPTEPQPKERTTRGEISIVVNAGETSNTVSNIINPADANEKGRVIYYNDDVRESGQLINAINLPIYGPALYKGKNFVFDLWMLELDGAENNQYKTLLTSLAGIGGKAYPPSSPILGLLNSLGSAILSGNHDDVEARFQMRFDVQGPSDSIIARLPLAEGYYAFVREENRDLNPEWNSIALNEGMGELCYSDDGGKNCKDIEQNTYRKRTWFLVRVAKEKPEAAIEMAYGEPLIEFLKKLETHEDTDTTEIKGAIDKLNIDLNATLCKKLSDQEKKDLKMDCTEKKQDATQSAAKPL